MPAVCLSKAVRTDWHRSDRAGGRLPVKGVEYVLTPITPGQMVQSTARTRPSARTGICILSSAKDVVVALDAQHDDDPDYGNLHACCPHVIWQI